MDEEALPKRARFEAENEVKLQGTTICPGIGIGMVRRHLLRHPEELRIQLRTILRAAVGCQVDILLPMVTTVDDIRQVKHIFEDVKEELCEEGNLFSDEVLLGAMIEVPAAAIG
jgi:phosphotransferase system enzyme I (PtsI)